MQVLLIALMLGVFLHDAVNPHELPSVTGGWLALIVFGPKLVFSGFYVLACRWVLRRLGTPAGPKALKRLDKLTAVMPFAAMLMYAADLVYGALRAVRGPGGARDVVLLDEVLVMLPTLALVFACWWAYYPVDRRLRTASLFARADRGLPVYEIWSRGQYLLAQLRHQVVLFLAPLLAIYAWAETVRWLGGGLTAGRGGLGLVPLYLEPVLTYAGAAVVFLSAPLIIRYIWDTAPLPPGEVRDRLERMCVRHGVKVRDLLLWRTFGGMINAAVMGLTPRLRYILLTDALLDQLHPSRVEAVMAHELGHVRLKHMPWLLGAAIGSLGLLGVAGHGLYLVLRAEPSAGGGAAAASLLDMLPRLGLTDLQANAVITLFIAAGWVYLFGWVSRRVERQADTFAVKDAVIERDAADGRPPEPGETAPAPGVVTHHDAERIIDALEQVAVLNHIPQARRSWRHGSIAKRQAYLRSLVGRRIDGLPIDQQMRWVQLGILAAVVLVLAQMTMPWWASW